MKIFIFVHGAWHGSWCWKIVTHLLQNIGHQVYAIDLPGHYNNKADFSNINLNSYVQHVKDFINSINKKVIIVGHSMAGIVISQVAEDIPEKIEKLIYISAFIPENRGSLIQEEQKAIEPSVSLEAVIQKQKNIIAITHSKKLRELFYAMCSDQQSVQAINQLQEQPLQPFLDHVMLSEKNFGKVDKLYIECLQDKAIHINDQRRMSQKLACKTVALDSDHSPFFSCPENLVKILFENS